MASTKHSSALRRLRRFCHLINVDKVFGTHNSVKPILPSWNFARRSSISTRVSGANSDRLNRGRLGGQRMGTLTEVDRELSQQQPEPDYAHFP